MLNQQKRGPGGERGPQVNHKRAVLYSEGLLRKSRLFTKETEVGLSSGPGWGQRGVCAAVVTFMGGGLGSQVEATSLSSPKRPCKEAGMHEETTRSTGTAEATRDGSSPGQGAGRDRSAPPTRVKGSERTPGPGGSKTTTWGPHFPPPPAGPPPVSKLETAGTWKCTVGAGGQTDGRAVAYRIHYEKAINFPRRFFFFLSVSFKKITILPPLPPQLTGLYSTTGQGRAGREGGREGQRLHK